MVNKTHIKETKKPQIDDPDTIAAFVRAYVFGADGVRGNGSQSARVAGYAPNSSSSAAVRLLASDKVQKAIQSELPRLANESAPAAVLVLDQLMKDARMKPDVRVKCAIALLDRGALAKKATTEIDVGTNIASVIMQLGADREARRLKDVSPSQDTAIIEVSPDVS
jgi:hypothetical protein